MDPSRFYNELRPIAGKEDTIFIIRYDYYATAVVFEKAFIYTRAEPIFSGKRHMVFSVKPREQKSISKAALLPFTVALDAATSPIQILMIPPAIGFAHMLDQMSDR